MEFTNFNIFKLIIFLIILLFILFIFYNNIINQKLFNNTFKLLSTNNFFYIKYIFLLLSFFSIFINIFWIKWEGREYNNENKWIDIVFVLDVSKSMNVADIKGNNSVYTRLDVIKDSISKYITLNTENRYSLVIFAWDAISIMPLTFDHDIFLSFLQTVDYRNLINQWSNFWKALTLWIDRFEKWNDRSKALVFISDWWDKEDSLSKNDILNITKGKEDISYFVVWVWTETWWKIIKWIDVFWNISYQTYNNQYVISKINSSNLLNISKNLGWEYFQVSDVDDLLKLNSYIKNLEKKALIINWNSSKNDMWRFFTFLWAFFFVLFLFAYFFENKIYFLKQRYEK